MSKDLNKEYLEMIEADLPDLWDRIEAALPEKEAARAAAAAGAESGKVVGITSASGTESEKVVDSSGSAKKTANEISKPKKTKIYRFGILAAACVCVAIVIPLAALNLRTKGSAAPQTQYATAAADTAAAEAVQEEMKEAAPTMEEVESEEEAVLFSNAGNAEIAEEDAVNDEGMKSFAASGAAGEPAETEMKASEAEVPLAEADMAERSAAPLGAAPEASEEPYVMDQTSPEEVLLNDVQIRITEKADYIGPDVFLAEVQTDTGYLTKGDIIFITTDDASPDQYRSGLNTGTYTCSLQETETEDGDTIYIIR